MKEYNIAIAGATGAVGQVFLSILEERNFPIKNLTALASSHSAGKRVKFKNEEIEKYRQTQSRAKDRTYFRIPGSKTGRTDARLCESDHEAKTRLPEFQRLRFRWNCYSTRRHGVWLWY